MLTFYTLGTCPDSDLCYLTRICLSVSETGEETSVRRSAIIRVLNHHIRDDVDPDCRLVSFHYNLFWMRLRQGIDWNCIKYRTHCTDRNTMIRRDICVHHSVRCLTTNLKKNMTPGTQNKTPYQRITTAVFVSVHLYTIKSLTSIYLFHIVQLTYDTQPVIPNRAIYGGSSVVQDDHENFGGGGGGGIRRRRLRCDIEYKVSASTVFITGAAGIVGRLVHISALCSLFSNAIKGKARTSHREVALIHHIVASSMAMSYMKNCPYRAMYI